MAITFYAILIIKITLYEGDAKTDSDDRVGALN